MSLRNSERSRTRKALDQAKQALLAALAENQALHGEVALLQRRLSTATDKQILLLNKLIAVDERVHLNSASALPPVECPLLIEVEPDYLVPAERTGHVAARGVEMEYRTSDGATILGRFRWTYP